MLQIKHIYIFDFCVSTHLLQSLIFDAGVLPEIGDLLWKVLIVAVLWKVLIVAVQHY